MPSEQHESTQFDVDKQLTAVFDLLLQYASTEPVRWKDLLDPFWRLPAEEAGTILDHLKQRISTVTDLCGIVWASLRELVSDGYQFGESWNIRPELLPRVAQLYENFRPIDKVSQLAWLFDNRTGIPESLGDLDKRHLRKLELQRLAVTDLWRSEDRWELLAKLTSVAVHTYPVGYALGTITDRVLDEYLLTGPGDARFSSLLPGFVWSRSESEGTDWVIRVLKDLVDHDRRNDALSISRIGSADRALWDAVDSIGEPFRSEFWTSVEWLSGEYSESDADRALEGLLGVGNVIAAANFAGYHPNIVAPGRALKILEALCRLDDAQFEPFVRVGSAGYVTEHLFGITDRDPTLNMHVIVQLEVFFLPLLRLSSAASGHLSFTVVSMVVSRSGTPLEVAMLGARGARDTRA
jgi:hypothetical protein